MDDCDFLNKVVAPYFREESEYVINTVKVIKSIARIESSVLNFREVAMDVGDWAVVQKECFNRAALVSALSSSAVTTDHSVDVANNSEYCGQST